MTKTIEIQLTIARPPAQVYEALVDAEALRHWFAEHADVSLEEARYGFWGRLTPETPDRDCGRHPLLEVISQKRLRYGWHMRGRDTTVTFDLQADRDRTRLRLVHDGLPAWRRGQHTMADFWTLSLENLRLWVERATTGNRCDFSSPMRGDVRLEVEIDAPREAVFAALTEPAQLDRYIAQAATVEPRVDGNYSFGWTSGGPVKVLQIVPNETLAYQWHYRDEPDTVVTWALEGSGGRTNLVLVHSGFDPEVEDAGYRIGWTAFMNRLKAMVESGPAWEASNTESTDYALA